MQDLNQFNQIVCNNAPDDDLQKEYILHESAQHEDVKKGKKRITSSQMPRISIQSLYKDGEIGQAFGGNAKIQKYSSRKKQKKQQVNVKLSDPHQLLIDIQSIKQTNKKQECIICQRESLKINQNIDSVRSFLAILCKNFEYPQTQQVVDFIKQITGKILLEDTETYHIQYDAGVNISLNHQVFDRQKLILLMDFVINLIITQNQQNIYDNIEMCDQHIQIKYQTQQNPQTSSLQQQWLHQYYQEMRNDTQVSFDQVADIMKSELQ